MEMMMSKQEPEYEEGLEPLTSAGIRSMCVGLSDEQQSNFMVEIGAAIERMVESDRVDVLVDESGDFIYQLTPKGIRWAKSAMQSGDEQ
jgi:hypothetical protein